MLQAFNQKKSRLYQRYLGVREAPEERRITAEDEITSLVMGSLAYLSPPAIGRFWQSLVHLYEPTINFPEGPPSTAHMQFWPKHQRVEPDLRVQLSWGNEIRILLVEFKWRAPLSSPRQLQDQWQHYLKPEERQQAHHMFIGLDVSEAINACILDDVWSGKLLTRNWFDVMTVLKSNPDTCDAGFNLWSKEVMAFFELLQVPTFHGFSSLTAPPAEVNGRPVFFNPSPDFQVQQ